MMTDRESVSAAPGKLVYPMRDRPGTGNGSAVRIADGVMWLRMPLGEGLDSINIWALADDGGWTIVDTGMRTIETEAAWEKAFANGLAGQDIVRVIVTHLHPDHCGMAGWLTERFSAPLWMTRREYQAVRLATDSNGRGMSEPAQELYHAAGWDQPSLQSLQRMLGAFGSLIAPLPSAYHRMVAGDKIRIGKEVWEVVIGEGHSPEHACLYNRQAALLISGDQILPTISSNISVDPMEPLGDPLSRWLATLAEIRDKIPNDVLVLPAHGEPFFGLHERINQLIAGHERSLATLYARLGQLDQRAIDVFETLFRRQVSARTYPMATGESLAHLSCLRSRGLAAASPDEDGVEWWRATTGDPRAGAGVAAR